MTYCKTPNEYSTIDRRTDSQMRRLFSFALLPCTMASAGLLVKRHLDVLVFRLKHDYRG